MKYNCNNSKLPILIFVASVIILSLYTSVGLYNKSKENKNTFRLHVVANSNNVNDQVVKLKVADKVEGYISTLLNKSDLTKQEVYNSIYSNIDEILLIANNELKDNNADYVSKAKLGKINYEEKENIYTTMDEGSYDSLQILLGKAEGKNYWNLIFPNKENVKKLEGLENVLPGITDIYEDEENLDKEVNDKEYTFKFLEVIQNIF